MAFVLKDRVKESSTTTGTGTFTLAGADTGYQSFSVIGDGNSTYYAIVGGSEWEVGIGTYTSSGTTLSRDSILESSNSGSAVNFSAGTKSVFVTYPAEIAVSTTGTETLTNKRVTPRINTNGGTTSGTITPNGDTTDQYNFIGLSGAVAIAAPSGTPTQGQRLIYRIEDDGTSRALDWTTAGVYRAIGVTLPTSTTAGKTTYVGLIYNSTDTKWDAVAVTTEE